MAKLQGSGLTKAYGVNTLFSRAEFTLESGERVGLVGANGAGKSTFLRCLIGQEEFDDGTISYGSTGATIGYVEQAAALKGPTIYDDFLTAFDDIRHLAEKKSALEEKLGLAAVPAANNKTAPDAPAGMDELLAEYGRILARFEHLDGYDYESRIQRIAFGLGFTANDFKHRTAELSGGQRTRVLLARALLREPDFLYLDEPTNHLDIQMIEWLEDFLKSYRGASLIISHDRAFLERVATKIIELDNQTFTTYQGSYSYFLKVKAARRSALETAYAKQQEAIHAAEEYIRRYRAGIKAKQARGRQSQLNRLERITLPPTAAVLDFFAFQRPDASAERVLETERLTFSYAPDKPLLRETNLLIKRGEGVALIGPNGIGKTTLLKIIVGQLLPTGGQLKLGNRVKIGYFSQDHDSLTPTRTVLDEIWNDYGLDEEKSRRYLGAFLFTGDDVHKKIADLSGGEKARLALLKLLLTGANFLILDEPTNHLDIPAKEAIELALMSFRGTFLVVSHDRYFLNRVTGRTLEFANGTLTSYDGPYDYYREKKAALLALADENAAAPSPKSLKDAVAASSPFAEKEASRRGKSPLQKMMPHALTHWSDVKKSDKENPPPHDFIPSPDTSGKKNRSGQKPDSLPPATKKPPPDQEKIARVEAEIAMCEAELKMLEKMISDPVNQADPKKSAALAADYAAKEKELALKYEKWGEVAC